MYSPNFYKCLWERRFIANLIEVEWLIKHPRSVCVRVSIFAAPVFIDVTADNGPETGQTWTLQKQTGKWNVVFVKFIFWVGAYHVIALNYWPATGHMSITFFFTQTEWFLPPHWSRSVVYERINHSTEDTICFSLWDKGKLSGVCKTESIPAFVANVCENEFIKTTKKKNSNG